MKVTVKLSVSVIKTPKPSNIYQQCHLAKSFGEDVYNVIDDDHGNGHDDSESLSAKFAHASKIYEPADWQKRPRCG